MIVRANLTPCKACGLALGYDWCNLPDGSYHRFCCPACIAQRERVGDLTLPRTP